MTAGETLYYPSATGECEIHARLWPPAGAPRAILQIAHGMAEHIARYAPFADFLNGHGILVAANDHAGHGGSLPDEAHKGYFCAQDGWDKVVRDMKTLHDTVAARYPGVPYCLFGHSMGSFLARTYAAQYGEGIAAFVFCGTAGRNGAIGPGKWIARLERRKNGPMQPSPRLERLCFGAYNKAFAPNRTAADWLSRDEAQVDRYVADPLCGFAFTAEAMLDLFHGLEAVSGTQWAARVPRVPILLIAGERDPVGANGKGVRQAAQWLAQTGHSVSLKLYPGARHEILNEINRQEVYEDILAFLQPILAE